MNFKDLRAQGIEFFSGKKDGASSGERYSSNYKFIVDEMIWGHRIYDEQTPEMVFLEFLNVLNDKKDKPLVERDNTLFCTVNLKPQLREILYNNPKLDILYADKQLSNEEKWEQWSAYFKETRTFPYEKPGSDDKAIEQYKNFLYFDEFAEIVFILRSLSFEIDSSKRWSSRFLFPVGADALFYDFNPKKKDGGVEASVDRRFFARTGELLYLMLSHSQHSEELGQKIVDKILNQKNSLNDVVKFIQAEAVVEEESKTGKSKGCYLPDTTNRLFDNLAKDFITILDLSMPLSDRICYLMQISTFYIIKYLLEKSKEVLKDSSGVDLDIDIVCEMVSTITTKVRSLSTERFTQNNALSTIVLKKYLDDLYEQYQNDPSIPSNEKNRVDRFIAYLEEEALISKNIKKILNTKGTIEEVQEIFTDEVLARHDRHLARVHAVYTKNIGLSSKVKTTRNRYILSDLLVKTFVFTIVKKRMPFHEFLDELYSRYSIVIGHKQATRYLVEKRCEQEAFKKNEAELERKLFALGLLTKLSDSYSYVVNPFSE